MRREISPIRERQEQARVAIAGMVFERGGFNVGPQARALLDEAPERCV